MSLVSVILPVGGVDPELASQLAALDAQNYSGEVELVVSLNTPDVEQRNKLDSALEDLQSLDVTVVDSSAVRSAAYARNVGSREASGEILAFCDGDDIVDKDWLSNLVKGVDNKTAVGGHLDEELLAIDKQRHWRPPATPNALPKFLGHDYLVSANMALTKESFDKVCGFREDLVRCEDIALAWDLLDAGVELVYERNAIVHYRHRKGLKPMIKQHYLYGKGFSQLLSRQPLPGGSGSDAGLKKFKANGQSVSKRSFVHYVRRGSIAVGRLLGLVQERFS